MKCLHLALFVAMVLSAQANSISTTVPSSSNDPANISHRLADLDLPLSTHATDAHLRSKLQDYLGSGSDSTEKMLGRASQYFPIFEYYLAKHEMPESLKYLAVAESMLVPRAVSSASAAGLWQLMPATARSMGLRVDGTVDERLDLYRATEAAVVMLKDLHGQFGDWHLALAAYNCGPGRVRRAITASGGYTYYPKVKPYLPKESQQYVAAYVAAAYTVNYYDDYGLTPAENVNEDELAALRVYRHLSLNKLADACGIPRQQLRNMNPSYLRGFVPANEIGYRVRIPLEKKWEAKTFIWGRPNLVEVMPANETELASQIVADLGFNARYWLLGCQPENLHATPSVVQLAHEERYNLAVAESYQAVAMLMTTP